MVSVSKSLFSNRPAGLGVSRPVSRSGKQTKRGVPGDPFWRSANNRQISAIPKERLPDILDYGSLTKRLLFKSEGNFQVKLVTQGWARPTFSEYRRLGLRHREYALIRSVKLCGKGEPWVIARSVIPASSLKGNTRFLASLGNKPLGAALFKDPGLVRTSFELACFEPDAFPEFELGALKGFVWGRRSVFHIQQKPLLVAEMFLPSCPPLH